jgi:hypothetical protein
MLVRISQKREKMSQGTKYAWNHSVKAVIYTVDIETFISGTLSQAKTYTRLRVGHLKTGSHYAVDY